MGFNIQLFFDELEEILKEDTSSEDMIIILEECIVQAKKYAIECGYIK